MAALPSDEALGDLFAPLDGAAGVLAAVSGGPDSIALMHLLARWRAGGMRPRIVVATVDHGLRPESAAEAAFVARAAQELGLPHRVLAWTGEKPRTGLQEAAREARYALLVRWAQGEGASHLVTAHTLDDQAETILMRLAKGSGPAGLAGMRRVRDRGGVLHLRPLLGWQKSALLRLCEEQGWDYVSDPSNADERFARVRWRRIMPDLAAEGLTAERLARFGARMALAEEALDAKAREAFERMRLVAGERELTLEAGPIAGEPFEIAVRVLDLALGSIGLDNSRLHRLEACAERLREAVRKGEGLGLTIAGAVLRLEASGKLLLRPEPPRLRGR
ncbi:tRNA lysidine(34) synthetase TilS [Microvirga roseola]|uniref:tRNA lysidine(34) synthetase TilS n=1 Tax=Microvirga roseola TaxID=2883126 RepID=UPI001E35E0CE|nr:tRNA lysidine(34) synthetase TilS [Microvirga roseola]